MAAAAQRPAPGSTAATASRTAAASDTTAANDTPASSVASETDGTGVVRLRNDSCIRRLGVAVMHAKVAAALGGCGGDGAPQNKLSWCDGVGAGAGPAGQAGPVRHAKPVGPIKTAGPAEPVVCVGTVRPARTTGHADSKKWTCRIRQTRHNRRTR